MTAFSHGITGRKIGNGEWIAAGADPNLAEPICYFAPRPE